MATEAQKLIGLSLTKIAQSRINRGGISLHKNLLVATVLQKARFIFMEEAYAASYANEVIPHESHQRLQPAPAEREEQERGKRVHKRRRESECDSETSADAAPKRCCGDDRLNTGPPSKDASFRHRLDGFSERSTADHCGEEDCEEPMEVDRITSLVSVFSFGANSGVEPLTRLGRSVSSPDLCSAQAKEMENIQRRTALAMAV